MDSRRLGWRQEAPLSKGAFKYACGWLPVLLPSIEALGTTMCLQVGFRARCGESDDTRESPVTLGRQGKRGTFVLEGILLLRPTKQAPPVFIHRRSFNKRAERFCYEGGGAFSGFLLPPPVPPPVLALAAAPWRTAARAAALTAAVLAAASAGGTSFAPPPAVQSLSCSPAHPRKRRCGGEPMVISVGLAGRRARECFRIATRRLPAFAVIA